MKKTVSDLIIAELSILHEISSLSFQGSGDDFAKEAMEKAARLFSVSRFAILLGPKTDRRLIVSLGFRDGDNIERRVSENNPGQFHYCFGDNGEIGSIFMEQTRPIDNRERRIYTLFARKVEDGIRSAMDTIERKRVEEAVWESETRYRAIVEAFDGLIYICSQDYRVEFMNKHLLERTGYDGTGELCYKVLHDRDSICPWCVNNRVFAGETVHWEVQSPKDNHWYYVVNVPMYHTDGSISKQAMILDITERKRAEKALKESESRLRIILDSVQTGIVVIDSETHQIIDANPVAVNMIGAPKEQIVGSVCHKYICPAEKGHCPITDMGHVVDNSERVLLTAGGEECSIIKTVIPVMIGGRSHLLESFVDITARKKAEEELNRVNRALRMMSITNQAMMHIPDEPTLLNEVCRIAVEVGGYRMAWVGFAEQDEAKTVRPVAHAGFDSGYIESAKVTWADDERGRGPGGIAIRTGQPCIVRDIPSDPVFAPWREEAQKRGYKSIIALPLIIEGRTLGALGIYAAERDAFDVEEANILKELAYDLAFGITALRMRAERDMADKALRDSEKEKTILNQIASVFLTVSDEAMYGEVLAVVLQAMKSKFGLFGYIGENGDFIIPSLTRDIWNKCQVPGKSMVFPSDSWGNSLWGRAIREKKAFYSDGPFRMPEGHIHIDHFLTVPIVYGQGTIGLISMANKEGGYAEEDKDLLERIASRVSPILHARLQRDIQERRRVTAEGELRESEEKYRDIFENAIMGIYQTTHEGRIISANSAFARILGYDSPEEVINTVTDLSRQVYVNPEKRSELMSLIEERNIVEEFEVQFYRKDKSIAWIDINVRAVRDGSGNLLYYEGSAQDITERKKAENALREIRRQQEALLNNIPDIAWLKDKESRFIAVNESFGKSCGFRPENLVGKTDLDVWPRDLAERYRSDDREVIGSGKRKQVEEPLIDSEGRASWMETIKTPIYNEKGEVIGIAGIARDITGRKQAEETLRQSEERYRNIFENAVMGIFHTTPEGRYLRSNPAGVRMYGYDSAEDMRKSVTDMAQQTYVDPKDRAKFKNIMERKGCIEAFEVEHYRKDKSKIWVVLNSRAVRDNDGRTLYYETTIEDITERKQSEILYRTLAESSHAGVFIIRDRKFQFVNPHILEYSGYSENELIGNDVLNFVHPEDRTLLRVSAVEMLKGRRTNPYEYRIIDSKGNIRRLMETVRSITYGGKRAVLGNTMDITERYQMESLLRQAQKMESIGTLAGGIAHDFNNILGAILGYTDMALADRKMGDRQRRYLEQVYKAGERARDLTKQILTFSRQQEQEKKPVLIAPIIKEGIKLLRSSLPTTVKITGNIKDTSLMVLADPTQIHQVVMNLSTNASHAMREKGGVLDIQLNHESIESSRTPRPLNLTAGNYAKLTVSDTGHGIDAAIMDRIFDPFFTTKDAGEGTGLGLSVVYGIVRDHGGAIDVSSEPGKETTVTVYFPLIETEELIQERMSELIPGGSERILFVDDEAALVELGSTMLTSLGYHVTTRTSSVDALEAFRASPYGFDLVITDMTMPNLRGDHLAKEMLKIRPDIPIILCTGFSEMISEEKAKGLGVCKFIMKPIRKNDLSKAVRDVLDR